MAIKSLMNTFLGFFKIQSGVDDVEEFASNNRQQQFFGDG